jgi:hypothetical protein
VGGEPPLPLFGGCYLHRLPGYKESYGELPVCYPPALPLADGADPRAFTWGGEHHPYPVGAAGGGWRVGLRRVRRPLPFALRLEDFTREFHPGTQSPKRFESLVSVLHDGSEERLRIVMNEPLRQNGYAVYQESWGPQDAAPGEPLFSRFAVMRNPADRWPLLCCIVIALGMLLHFGRNLLGYVRREAMERDTKSAKGRRSPSDDGEQP